MTWLERLGGPGAVTRGVVEEFRSLSGVPHASHHEEAVGALLAQRLAGLGLFPVRDGAGNLMAEVPAAPGREGAPRVILQGHMDMVCAAAPGSGFDPLRDPVTVVERDGVLRSDGRSSLGADNMLGNAAVLWLLATGRVDHGPLRLLFTVAEEVGLEGAKQVAPAWLAGARYLLNTDGFHLGRAVVGSASGRRETYTRPLETCPAPEGPAWQIALTGGLGGHSGDDIHWGRSNAVALLAEYLRGLDRCALADFRGGTAHNAIPSQAEARVVLPGAPDLDAFARRLRAWYGESDPELTVTCKAVPRPDRVWTPDCAGAALALAAGLFHGVRRMDPAFPGVVGASANVGRLSAEEGQVQVCAFLRSARPDWEAELAAGHDGLASELGFARTVTGYPGWPGDRDNPLARVLEGAFRRTCGRGLEVSAVHVGLEPSIFQSKAPGLIMASTGPDILDAHSVSERAPLAGLPDYVLLLAETLEELGQET